MIIICIFEHAHWHLAREAILNFLTEKTEHLETAQRHIIKNPNTKVSTNDLTRQYSKSTYIFTIVYDALCSNVLSNEECPNGNFISNVFPSSVPFQGQGHILMI